MQITKILKTIQVYKVMSIFRTHIMHVLMLPLSLHRYTYVPPFNEIHIIASSLSHEMCIRDSSPAVQACHV